MSAVASKFPYYPMFVDDFDGSESVLVMTLAEKGLYLACLNHAWKEGSIPSDPARLAAALKQNKREVLKLWETVKTCWSPLPNDPTRLVNRRQEIERGKVAEKSRKAASAARSRNGRSPDDPRQEPAPPRASGSLCSFEVEVEEKIKFVADRIYARHPAVRRCGNVEIIQALTTISAKGTQAKRIEILELIDKNHELRCATEQWTKDGGEYAKELSNWLAPTKKRYLETPPMELFQSQLPQESKANRQFRNMLAVINPEGEK